MRWSPAGTGSRKSTCLVSVSRVRMGACTAVLTTRSSRGFRGHPSAPSNEETMPPAITVSDLGKTYVVPEREGGVRAALAALVRRRTRDVQAVAEVSFTIEQ